MAGVGCQSKQLPCVHNSLRTAGDDDEDNDGVDGDDDVVVDGGDDDVDDNCFGD